MENEDKFHIGKLIKEQLQEKNMKQSDLAACLGCKEANISKKLNGNRLTVEELMKISKAIGCDLFNLISQLLGIQKDGNASTKLSLIMEFTARDMENPELMCPKCFFYKKRKNNQ